MMYIINLLVTTECPDKCTSCDWDDTIGEQYRTDKTARECTACESGYGVQEDDAGIRTCMGMYGRGGFTACGTRYVIEENDAG